MHYQPIPVKPPSTTEAYTAVSMESFWGSVENILSSSYLLEDAVIIISHVVLLITYVLWCSRQRSVRKDAYLSTNGFVDGDHDHVQCQASVFYKATFLCCIYVLLANTSLFVWTVYWKFRSERPVLSLHAITAAFVQALAWLLMSSATLEAKKKGRVFYPSILRTWWVLSFLFFVYSSLFNVRDLSSKYSLVTLCVSLASSPATAFLFVVAVLGHTGINYVKSDLHEPLLSDFAEETCTDLTPYSNAGFLSVATLSWLDSLLYVGSKKTLELKDIPLLAVKDRVEVSYLHLKSIMKQCKLNNPSKVPSLTKAIIMSFWMEAGWSAVFAAINTCTTYVGPFLIKDFVEYLSGTRRFKHEGYVLASLFLGAKLTETLTQRQWYMGIDLLGMHVRAALTAFVYRKGLRLSSQSRQSHSGGEIINYMSVDIQRVGDFTWYLHDIWVLPLQIVLALVILYRSVGVAFIATLAATVISIVANTPLARLQENYQDHLMTAKDERMRATSECLRSMRILKLQAWEERYRSKIEHLRNEEYRWLRKSLFAQAAVTFVFWGAPIFVSVVTFSTCIVLSIPLTTGRVLSALATFRILQEPLRNFPDLVAMIAQTKVSLDRLSSFLEEEELQKDAVSKVDRNSSSIAVEIKDGTFSWDLSCETPTLSRINVSINKGLRVAICGKVGSGKTSLLSCILGEMPKLAGTVKVCGQTAYVSQSAWIETGNIEENILFGSPMDKYKYKNVLEVCALKKDLTLLSHGDQTIIGERGINLSGGQKQRVQLARAIYKDADIYLLDDPFSAVDAHTGSELFKDCILGALLEKTVIYVTHQVEFLPAADFILVLRDGHIIQAGKYEDLLHKGTDFNTLVSAHNEAIESMDVAEYVLDEADESENPTSSIVNAEEESSKNCEIEKVPTFKGADKSCESQVLETKKKMKETKKRKQRKQLVQEEEREKGSVSWQVYRSYMMAAYRGSLIPVIVLAQVAFQLLQISSNWWMAWASSPAEVHRSKIGDARVILVYMVLAFGSAFCVFLRALCVSIFGIKAAQKLFLNMLVSIFRAPMSFFDSTPTGRILNRVSSDQSVVDLDIPFRLASFASTTIQLLGIVLVMCQVAWQVLLLFLPVAAACLWLQRYYMASARELTRLSGVQKSPIIHHFGESISGALTIRGFEQQKRFMKRNFELFDNYGRPYFNSFSAIEWLCLRMELLSTIVFGFSMVFLVSFPPGNIDPSMAGLAVTYGLNLNARQSRWVLSLCKLENKIISVERIQQYTRLPREADGIIPSSRPPACWPNYGFIQFQQLQVRYAQHLPFVLHGITCSIPGGKKVGVVGRTGSGKSTLIQALFRIVEPAGGKIVIDGIDIASVGLHDLRSRIGIIPQEPTLFEGTMRANLDPLEEHTDLEIWEALDKCQLGDSVRAKESKLETAVSENGENWSVGQRQLVCLGRALLRRSRILVLDEATASVDTATDGLIQRTIREELNFSTVITVAHRIPTVIDSDFVLVLSDGKVAEYDTPLNLLEDKASAFLKLVSEYTQRSTSVTDLVNLE